MARRKANHTRKSRKSAKKLLETAASAALLAILTFALIVFVNEKFIRWDFIPSSADIVHFFGGGGTPYVKPLDDEAAVYFIDVGQGDCELIRTKNCNILIDCGEEENADEVIGFIRYSGVERLDYVIATHPHSDHIGGMYRILESFDVGTVIIPKIPRDIAPNTLFYSKMLNTIKNRGINREYSAAGKIYTLGENASLEIIAPLYDEYEELNNFSVVARLTHGANTFLFTGDAESLAELDILDNGIDVSADVLKVAHHGSAGANSRAYLEKVRPKIAVIGVGSDNSYGHPHKEVLKRLAQVGCDEIYTTAADGNVVIISDGASLRVRTEEEEIAA
ncbi:MAG TPA: MBL fold metallo-hydrolase [Ruminococcaceae bacterium]|nr:MBL fold metallo-hydrolase [Oscillospiraceae bacterium]